jgi:hypothetical protein
MGWGIFRAALMHMASPCNACISLAYHVVFEGRSIHMTYPASDIARVFFACVTAVRVQKMTSLNDATNRLLLACLDRMGLKISQSTTFMSQPLCFCENVRI